MRIKSVICSVGRSGYMHRDLMAIKAGAKPDGFLFHGKPHSAGFKKIVEPATIVSVQGEIRHFAARTTSAICAARLPHS